MLIVGHEVQCRISALACRIESRNHIGKQGNPRQVSGASDASRRSSGLSGVEEALCYRTRVIDPNSNLGKLLKRTSGTGNEPELEKKTEWSYHYKTGEKSYFTIPKFLADGGFEVSALEIR